MQHIEQCPPIGGAWLFPAGKMEIYPGWYEARVRDLEFYRTQVNAAVWGMALRLVQLDDYPAAEAFLRRVLGHERTMRWREQARQERSARMKAWWAAKKAKESS